MVHSVFVKQSSPHAPSCDAVVAAFQHLCRRGARKFWRAGLERCDLEQVAAIGLIKAARRYDAALDTPFEAYAWLMIVGELMHHVRDHERVIRIPRRLAALERRYALAHETLLARHGREPHDAELADEIGVLVPVLAELRRTRECAVPARIEDEGADAVPHSDALTLEERIMIDDAFCALSRTERRVVAGIYLLGLTQLEVSRRLGVSPKRVSRMHNAALVRMQRALAS